ncbi:uncharacterized protein LOC110724953 isoform X1 [Chenopodium quinoa]|uniref:uncharacterized protein LOC110724953 isoform X1 n=1 Tax=Chenopodium quinoa TaxID=63459 RepID=UPI000B77870A|nr:uncharacterized protein LOC110724953 isoform X1 [Chenopodium quinoa]
MGKIYRKQMVGDRTKIAEKMSVHMMLMGYNGDYKSMLSQELNSRLWKRDGKLSRKRMRRFHFLLFTADSPTLLSFTVALGRLIWSNKLMAKRRNFEKKLSEKIKEWSVKKKKRRGKPGKLRARKLSLKKGKRKKRKEYVAVSKIVFGFQMRPVLGSRLRMVIKRKVRRHHSKSDHGSQMYRLAMAIKYLSLRNVYVTSEWEFWTICFVQEVTGFWGSIALQEDLSNSLSSVAKEFGLYVVSADHLARLESGFGCSSSLRCVGNDLISL